MEQPLYLLITPSNNSTESLITGTIADLRKQCNRDSLLLCRTVFSVELYQTWEPVARIWDCAVWLKSIPDATQPRSDLGGALYPHKRLPK
jgi:hypothetical protein